MDRHRAVLTTLKDIGRKYTGEQPEIDKKMFLKLWQNKKCRNLFEMPTKNDVFFSAAIIFDGHLKQIFDILISLGL